MWYAVICNNTSVVKVLIDFGGDRTIKSNSDDYYPNTTPLDIAKKFKNQEIIAMLTEYFPSEEEKLASQIKYKRIVDSKFKDSSYWIFRGHPRFKQVQIDLKYDSLSLCLNAVITGDLDILAESLTHVDVRMAVSLTLITIERDHFHLMGCLFEKLIRENALTVITDKESIEQLLLSGIDATVKSNSTDVIEMVKRSRVLSLFKILYHKYIYLNVETIFNIVQTLMHEDLNKPEPEPEP